MQWLTSNPISDMYGTTFLVFYSGVIITTLITCWLARRSLDWTARMPPPPVPSAPDPHETAYLRGGENEVARSIIFTLIQKNLLRLKQTGADYIIEPAGERIERRTLSPIERRSLDWFAAPQPTSKIFKADGLAAQLRPFCTAYEQRLRRERFLPTDEMKERARVILYAGALVIAGLGAYKLIIALARGRFNVLFLVALGALGLFALFKVCRVPRQTRRGRVYLERMQTAFERLKNRPATAQPRAPETSKGGTEIPSAASAYALDPTFPLLVGIFGVGALAGTQYDLFHQSFRRSAMNDGGAWAGSSCGSCGSSDGSGGGGGCSGGCGGGCGGCGG